MAMLVITRGYLPPTRRDQSSSHRHGFGKTGDMSHVIPGIQESGTRSAFTRSPGLEKPLNRSIGGFSSNDWITIPCDEDQPLVAKFLACAIEVIKMGLTVVTLGCSPRNCGKKSSPILLDPPKYSGSSMNYELCSGPWVICDITNPDPAASHCGAGRC